MKNKILLPLVCTLVLRSAGAVIAQTAPLPGNTQEISVSTDTLAQFTLFAGRFVEGKTYLHWDVKDQQCDGLYIVYRSTDGEQYQVLGHKRGIGVPVSVPIAWYLQDETPALGTTCYRVVHIAQDGSRLVSGTVYVKREETLLSRTE